MSVLDEIVANTRAEVARRRSSISQGTLERQCGAAPPARDFEGALRPSPGTVRLIAEVKKASPSRGVLARDLDPVTLATTYATHGAHAISVLTDEKYFHGSLDDLRRVRSANPEAARAPAAGPAGSDRDQRERLLHRRRRSPGRRGRGPRGPRRRSPRPRRRRPRQAPRADPAGTGSIRRMMLTAAQARRRTAAPTVRVSRAPREKTAAQGVRVSRAPREKTAAQGVRMSRAPRETGGKWGGRPAPPIQQ